MFKGTKQYPYREIGVILTMIPRGLNPWHILTLAVLMLSILLTTYNVHHLHILQKQHLSVLHPESADCTLGGGPTYSVFAKVKQNKRRNNKSLKSDLVC